RCDPRSLAKSQGLRLAVPYEAHKGSIGVCFDVLGAVLLRRAADGEREAPVLREPPRQVEIDAPVLDLREDNPGLRHEVLVVLPLSAQPDAQPLAELMVCIEKDAIAPGQYAAPGGDEAAAEARIQRPALTAPLHIHVEQRAVVVTVVG